MPKQSDKKRRLVKIVVIVAVVLVTAGAGVALRWFTSGGPPPATDTVVRSSQEQAAKGNADAAQAELDKALEKSDLSDDEKHRLHFEKGNIYLSLQDLDKAMDQFTLAEQSKKTDSVYQAMAQVSLAKKDTAQALTYFQQALDAVDPTHPNAEKTKELIQLNIDILQGKPLPGPPESLRL